MDDYNQLIQDLADYYAHDGKPEQAYYSAQLNLAFLGGVVVSGETYSGERDLIIAQIEKRAAQGREYREGQEVAA